MKYISPDIRIINKGKAEKDDFLLMAIKIGLRDSIQPAFLQCSCKRIVRFLSLNEW